jgi:hypothetical protein
MLYRLAAATASRAALKALVSSLALYAKRLAYKASQDRLAA